MAGISVPDRGAGDTVVATARNPRQLEESLGEGASPVARGRVAPIRFTFFWPETRRWEGRELAVDVEDVP